jgi:hypothetical protein
MHDNVLLLYLSKTTQHHNLKLVSRSMEEHIWSTPPRYRCYATMTTLGRSRVLPTERC